jgi:hypothetical protein
MASDWFLLIHSCVASSFLFGIYLLPRKKPFRFLLVPSASFWIAWMLAATSLSCHNYALEDSIKLFTMIGVYFGFIALVGLIITDSPQIQSYWQVLKHKLMKFKNKLKKRKQP